MWAKKASVRVQQQPRDGWLIEVVCPGLMVAPDCSLAPAVEGPIRALISLAIIKNACSTFVAFFAEVSINGMPTKSKRYSQ